EVLPHGLARTMDERLREGRTLAVHVRRETSLKSPSESSTDEAPEEWKNRFYIVFEGLLREWYVIISEKSSTPCTPSSRPHPGKVTYMIYESSQTNPNTWTTSSSLDVSSPRPSTTSSSWSATSHALLQTHSGKARQVHGMESEDYAFYKGLEFLVNNKKYTGVWRTEIRDLIPNGRNITVTEETKLDYIRLVLSNEDDRRHSEAAERIPGRSSTTSFPGRLLISIFNEQELELLLKQHGLSQVPEMSLQIIWFWRALRSFDQDGQGKVHAVCDWELQGALQGFAYLEGMNGVQKFQIHRDDRSTDRLLPSAHTCFNQLDLPAYETYDKLRTLL
ncbi:Uncharacterized protein FKW44_019981, partial [Caligus rogercresseyi]